MQYAIDENFIEQVEKKLNRIANRCKRNGNDFSYSRVGVEYREEETKSIFGRKIKKTNKFILIEVSGTAKVEGYELAAVLSVRSNGNIVRKANVPYDIPETFRTSSNKCDHCNCIRRRNDLYVVRNTTTGEFKQIGSDCLLDYTCGLNAEYVASFMDGVTELEAYNGMLCHESSGRYYYPVETVIAYAQEIIQKIGYFNTSSAVPTSMLVRKLLSDVDFDIKLSDINTILAMEHFSARFERSDFFKPETESIVKGIIEHYSNEETTSDFIHNVKLILSEGYMLSKDVGYISYLPEGYAKFMHKQTEKAKRFNIEKHSSFFGEEKKRYKSEPVKEMLLTRTLDTMFGAMYIYKIVLESCDVLIWKTGTYMNGNERGNVKCIDFTVKGHEEYNGIKQTEITRTKVSVWRNAA